MGNYKHLKDHAHYSELYDKLTIEKCQRWDNTKYPKDISKLKGKEKKLAKIKKEYFEKSAVPLVLNIMKADYASKKSEVIQEWVKRDQAKDEKVANAREPQGIRCFGCSSLLKNCTSRDLMDNHQGKEEVMFMFECEKCGKRRAYWENGKEWERKPTLCSKCRAETQHSSSRKGEVIATIYSCSQCGNKETDVFDMTVKEKPADPNFEMNRKKYYLSDKEGMEYISQKEGMKEIERMMDEAKERKQNKALYDAIAKIKKLTIFELQKLLDPILEKAGYVKLEFEKPELQKDVVLGFSVQDSKSGRSEWDSIHELQKLLRKSLEETNWRLMSDGVNYRLGFLTGRLRGVEGEENLKKLVENIKKLTK